MSEPLKIEFTEVVRVLEITFGRKSAEAKLMFWACDACGALVDDDMKDRQKHADFHGKIAKHAQDLHAHTRAFLAHGAGPIT